MDYFAAHAGQYLRFLMGEAVGLFFVLGLLGSVLLLMRREQRALGLAVAGIVVPSTLLYMAYYWAPGRAAGTMRFVLPTFPVWLLAGFAALAWVAAHLPAAPRRAVVSLVLALQIAWGTSAGSGDLGRLTHQKHVLATVTRALVRDVPAGSTVIAHRQILQHLDFVRQWQLVDPSLLRGGGRSRPGEAGNDAEPRPMQAGKREAQLEVYAGMRPMERERAARDDIMAWAGDAEVFYIGTEEEIAQMRGAYFHPENFTTVQEIELPAGPAPESRAQGERLAARPPPPGDAAPGVRPAPRDLPGGPGRRRDFLRGATELVIAKWTPRFRMPERRPRPPPRWR
jgi:hypothetical protein